MTTDSTRSGNRRLSLLSLAAVSVVLAACGGGGGDTAVAPAPVAPTGLAGTVAVGAPITDGKVRVFDAAGNVVASDIVVASDGSYTVPTLSGSGPYRIEACGYAGAVYQCMTSVSQGAGTANVTPLTNAAVLLATGTSAAEMTAAQDQLRAGLAGVMAGNVPGGFDFVSGSLDAGSRTGYDKLLDAVGVSTGVDGSAFVQITPRMGSGNLYLQTGSSSGSVTVDPNAAALSLSGLEQLFANMSAAMAGATACAAPNTGMVAQIYSAAHVSMDGPRLVGPAEVGAGLCAMFGEQGLWGARLLSPTLGRCDLSGAEPRCRVSFVLQMPDGGVTAVGNGMGVAREGGAWKFMGSYYPLAIDASSRAQRNKRVDGTTPVVDYERAIAIDIEHVAGVACAKVSQTDSSGNRATVAYFKPQSNQAERLSAWHDANGGLSFDPANGELRSSDDSWLMLPQGADGDAVVRNFLRGGRTVTVALYGDDVCNTPFALEGHSEFEVDVDGIPPVWAAMASLPWPELNPTSVQALADLNLDAGSSANFALGWTFPHGYTGIDGLTFCAGQADCGDGSRGRLGSRDISPATPSATIALQAGANALGNSRMVALYGSLPDGLRLQANFLSCVGHTADQRCP